MATKKLSIALAALTTPAFGAQVTMPSFKIGSTAVTASGTEMNYLVGVTSAIQTQINTKLASSSYTAADVLTKIKTVDGAASGLDADLLDGQHGSYYAPIASPTFSGTVTGSFSGNLTGNVTGNLTGNVTGNCSGSSGSCTGNSATATLATTATNAVNLTTTNFTIAESGGNLLIRYGATTIVTINSIGEITAKDFILS